MQKAKSKKPIKQNARIKKHRKHSLIRQAVLFLPAIIMFGASGFMHASSYAHRLSGNVLSYSTSMSVGDLLTHTNNQRTGESATALTLNAKLNSAAQAKANDMVARDYWSHVTPDGEEPWVFIEQAGYAYKAAGENLAYGFLTSSDTVTGWMNSPPHRQNLMNTTFTEVGFGFANSSNFVGGGEHTVIVAMYGAPLNSSAPATATSTAPPTQAESAPVPTSQKAAAEEVTQTPIEPVTETPAPISEQSEQQPAIEEPIANSALTAPQVKVSKIQLITAGDARWSNGLLIASIIGAVILWGLQRAVQIRRFALAGERFVLRHIHLDFTILAVVVFGWTLLQTSGVVR